MSINAPELSPVMTDAQRQCLSHIIRNCASTLESLAYFTEEHHEEITHESLRAMLEPTHAAIGRILQASQRCSFCALDRSDCTFVAPFVGCSGVPK